MPKGRPPSEVWQEVRRVVWERDDHRCVRCVQLGFDQELPLDQAHSDHVVSGKRGTNRIADLRTLSRYHHVLRADHRHRGMITAALRDEIIPADWREYVWDGCAVGGWRYHILVGWHLLSNSAKTSCS